MDVRFIKLHKYKKLELIYNIINAGQKKLNNNLFTKTNKVLYNQEKKTEQKMFRS